jgi:hypothetical protein
MKVLSIDLDYIMSPSIELYYDLFYSQNPTIRWKDLYNHSDFRDSHIFIDQSNLIFCFDVFLKALKNGPIASFGYEHDSILYKLHDCENIDLINIDHHDDVMHGSGNLSEEYDNLDKFNAVNEGNWGAWLHARGKLNSFTWIHNKNSSNLERNDFNVRLLDDKYRTSIKEEYKFQDYNFDYIFVCLSPQYIPKNHWHYFTMFMMAYEEVTGKDASIIHNKKFESEFRHKQVTDEILHQCSNGR